MNTGSIKRIVKTGGPCSGKSTGIAKVTDTLLDRGKLPFLVTESVTELDELGLLDFSLPEVELQTKIIRYQLKAEQTAERYAKMISGILQDRQPVIIYDRGIADARAYIDYKKFDKVLYEQGFQQGVTDIFGRYDMVVHMETAPKEFYTTENNPTRREKTREEGMLVNDAVRDAWLGHPHRRMIGNNYFSFDEKIQATTNEILHFLGDPESYEWEDKYEVVDVDLSLFSKHGISLVESDVEQDYLVSTDPHKVRRVRRRGWAPGCRIYTYTEKNWVTKVEDEKIIHSPLEYHRLLSEKSLGHEPLKKKRYNFVWDGHYFELDYFLTGNKKGKWLLEIEKLHQDQKVDLPPFLNIVGQVERGNEEMARIRA